MTLAHGLKLEPLSRATKREVLTQISTQQDPKKLNQP